MPNSNETIARYVSPMPEKFPASFNVWTGRNEIKRYQTTFKKFRCRAGSMFLIFN